VNGTALVPAHDKQLAQAATRRTNSSSLQARDRHCHSHDHSTTTTCRSRELRYQQQLPIRRDRSQLIYDFGQTTGRWNAAKTTARSQVDSEVARRSRFLQCSCCLLNAAATYALVKVAQDGLTNQASHLVQARVFVRAGTSRDCPGTGAHQPPPRGCNSSRRRTDMTCQGPAQSTMGVEARSTISGGSNCRAGGGREKSTDDFCHGTESTPGLAGAGRIRSRRRNYHQLDQRRLLSGAGRQHDTE